MSSVFGPGQWSIALASPHLACASLGVRYGRDEQLLVTAINPDLSPPLTSRYYLSCLTDEETGSRG